MPADLDQFGCQNSHGTVVGREGFVQLGHVAADARGFFDQTDLEAGGGKIQRCLNAADPAADNQHIGKIAVSQLVEALLQNGFRNQFVSHFSITSSLNERLHHGSISPKENHFEPVGAGRNIAWAAVRHENGATRRIGLTDVDLRAPRPAAAAVFIRAGNGYK